MATLYITALRPYTPQELEAMAARAPAHIQEKRSRPGSLAAWALLRGALMEAYGLSELPEVELLPGGKPCFAKYPHIQFSLSHTDKAAACAIHSQSIGCDLEPEDRRPGQILMDKTMTPKERELVEAQKNREEAFMTLWTMKEAHLKRTGQGLAGGIGKTDMSHFFPSGGHNSEENEYCHTARRLRHIVSVCTSAKELRVVEV